MKLKVDLKSIKFKIWIYILLFSLAILLLLWMLQTVFLNNFYKSMKQQNITQGAEKIATIYSKIQGQELESQIKTIADESDISVNIIDSKGIRVINANPTGRDYMTPMKDIRIPFNDNKHFDFPSEPGNNQTPFEELFKALSEKIRSSPDAKLFISFEDLRGRDMLFYGVIVTSPDNKEAILITSSPLQPLDDTIAILSRQLIYVTIIIVVLTFIFSLVIATHVSRPIIHITGKASKLADGNFDMKFERGAYSEVTQLAETLNYAAKGMQQAEKMRNELIANISHDLRTPLTMIRLYAEMIRDLYRDDPAERDQNVAVIIEESDRLTSLVQNILELSRLQAGADTCRLTVFDLTRTINGMLKKFDALVKKEGYTFIFKAQEPFYVKADEAKIELVLYNLLTNAVHYTGEDKTIHIAVVERGEKLRVLIRDTGEGIAPENIDYIWDRYYKEGKEHKRAYAGTGLGLAIVKSILVMHGTDFGVDSVVGSGSTFWFELDKAEQED